MSAYDDAGVSKNPFPKTPDPEITDSIADDPLAVRLRGRDELAAEDAELQGSKAAALMWGLPRTPSAEQGMHRCIIPPP